MNWNEYFTYESETGNLIWKERPRGHFSSEKAAKVVNSTRAGKIAGHDQGAGAGMATYVRVDGKMYRAHRVIWEMTNGLIPDGMLIDHIDGDYHNNRIGNLRLATKSQNGMNRLASKRSALRLKGVSLDSARGLFVAQIVLDGKTKNLGRFESKGMAALVYAKTSLRMHGKFSPFYRKIAAGLC